MLNIISEQLVINIVSFPESSLLHIAYRPTRSITKNVNDILLRATLKITDVIEWIAMFISEPPSLHS